MVGVRVNVVNGLMEIRLLEEGVEGVIYFLFLLFRHVADPGTVRSSLFQKIFELVSPVWLTAVADQVSYSP